MNPLPMSIISGYLGAGKTTFLNRLLAEPDGVRYAVLVNDFGDIAIDEALIENQTGDVIALSNGCVCCSIDGDLYTALDFLLSAPERPDHLVLEASGVADPSKLVQIAVAEPELKNAGVLTLIDSVNISAQLTDPHLRDSVLRQIACADQLALSKFDLASSEEILSRVAELAQSASVQSIAIASQISARDLLPVDGAGVRGNGGNHAQYATWSYRGEGRLDLDQWKAVLTQGDDVLRMKGFLNTHIGGRHLVQLAGTQWQASAASRGLTELVVIGLKDRLKTDRLEAAFS